MAVIAVAELLVEPSFKGVHEKMRRETDKTMPRAGRDAGQKLGKGMADGFSAETSGLEAEVSRLAQSVAKASTNVAASKKKMTEASAAESKALGDLRVAELRLQETRDNSAAKASQVAAAEERVEAALHRAVQATERRETADRNLSRATADMATEQDRASQATAKLETHLKRVSEETTRTERSTNRLASAMRGAFRDSPLSGLVTGVKRDTDRVQIDLHQMAQNVSQQGTRGGRAFTQGFIVAIGGLSAITPAVGGAGAALLAAAAAATTLGGSLTALGGVAAVIPGGMMAIGAGAGVLVAAFRGVGEAMKTATDQQGKFVADSRLQAMAVEDASRAIEQAEENVARVAEDAARRVSDAKRSLQDTIAAVAEAEENAADAIEAATRRVVDAKRAHADAVRAAANAEESAAESQENAARRVRDAKLSLQDAVERVAEAQVSAARAVEQAERRQAEASRDVLDAQNALLRAREQAAQRSADLARKASEADRKTAETAEQLQRAQEAFDKVRTDPAATALQVAQAQVAASNAASADKQAKRAVDSLRAEHKAAKRGSESVVAAERKVADARRAQADAARARRDAEARAVKQQRDAARQVARAQESVADALKDQKKAHRDAGRAAEDAARRVADAQRGITEAIEDEKEAREDAGKAAKEGARRISDAQRAIKDATRDSAQAQKDAARGLEQAHRGLERVQIQQADAAKKAGHDASEAMDNLTPSAREATRAMLGLYDELGKVRRIAQEGFFKGFTAPLMALSATVLPQLATGVGTVSSAFGQSAQIFMDALNNAFKGGVLESLMMGVADTVTVLNGAIKPLVDAFVTLGVVGMDYMPRLAQAIVDMTTQFDAFIQKAAADGSLDAWIEAGIQGWKDVGSIIASVVGIFGALNDAAEAGGAAVTLGGLAQGLRDVESAMQGEVFQTTMATIFSGAAAGARALGDALGVIGQAFVAGAPAFAEFLRLGSEVLGMFVGGVFTALSNPDFGAGLTTFLEGLRAGVEQMVPLMPHLTSAFGSLLTALAPIVAELGPSLVEVFSAFGTGIAAVLSVLQPLLVALADSPIILGILIASFTATAAASAALTMAGNVQRIAMAGWAVAAGIVKGALFLLKMEWLKTAAAAVISGAQTAAVWLMYRMDALKAAAVHVAQAARIVGGWIAMQVAAVTSGIKTAAVWTGMVIANAAKGAASFVVSAARVVGGWVLMSVQSLLHAGRMAAAWFIALGPIGWAIAAIVGIAAIVIANWDKIKKWTVDTWNAISGKVKDVWEKNIKPVFDAFGSFIKTHVAPAFQKGVDAIKGIWEKVQEIAKNPVKFMVETVYNKGIRGIVNGLVKNLKLDGIIPELPELKVKGFARGGWTGPGSKFQEAGIVHADEFVVRKESQRDISRKAPGLLDAMNQYGAKALGYFTGGLVTPVHGPLTSRFGAPRGRYPHAGVDYAVPIGTLVKSALDGIVERIGNNIVTGRTGKGMLVGHDNGMKTYYGHLSEFIAKVGQQVKAGEGIAKSGNTGKSTGPHLHFETWKGGKAVDPLTGKGGLDTGDSGGGGWNPLGGLLDFITGIPQKISDAFPQGNLFVDMMTETAGKVFGAIPNVLGNVFGGVGDFLSPTAGGMFDINKGAKDQVRGVAKGYGWDQGEMWNALHEIVNRESSWRTDAANPTSSARGLFQKMTSIHGPIEGSAGDQAGWGLHYIRERYGNPVNALMHHNRRGWYADGGLVTGAQALLRDQGGTIPPGLQLVANLSGRDELMLNHQDALRTADALRGGESIDYDRLGDVLAERLDGMAVQMDGRSTIGALKRNRAWAGVS